MKRKVSLFLLTCLVMVMSLSIPAYAVFEDVSSANMDLVYDIENEMTDVSSANMDLLYNAENVVEEAEKIVEEIKGTQEGTYKVEELTFDTREVVILTITSMIGAVMLYFITKLAIYFAEMSKYRKAVKEGKEGVIKPKVVIKLKYLILLIIILDVLIWSSAFIGSL